MSYLSNLLSSELKNFSNQSINSLTKVAALRKISAVPPWLVNGAKNLFHYGVPVGAGLGAGYEAHQHGMDNTTSIATGAGLAAISSPRNWMDHIHDAQAASKLGRDPFTAFSKSALKDLAIKGGTVAGVAGLDKGYPILDNIENSTKNTADITKAFAANAPGLSADINSTMGGVRQFWDPHTGTAKQLTDMATNIGTGKSKIDISLNPESKKFIEHAGLAGGGLIGGGMLLHHLLNRNKQKNKQPV